MRAFFEGNALIFTIPALAGTLFFLLRMGLMALGGHGEADIDADVDFDVDTDVDAFDVDAAEVADSTDAFKLLSLQVIAGFVMGFGWAGLIGFVSLGWEVLPSALLGLGGGVAVGWFVAWAFNLIYSLQESGNISIDMTMGKEGNVYAQVPARSAGKGQVKLVVNQRARIFNAITEGEEIPTNARVRVVNVNNDNSVTVVPV